MSKKGGYVIVDLKGQSITAGTPFTLDGVTARLNRAKNKACLLSGFAIGNDEKRDVFVDLQPTADGYAGTIDGYQITIEDDEVTFTAQNSVRELHVVKKAGNLPSGTTIDSGYTTKYFSFSLMDELPAGLTAEDIVAVFQGTSVSGPGGLPSGVTFIGISNLTIYEGPGVNLAVTAIFNNSGEQASFQYPFAFTFKLIY